MHKVATPEEYLVSGKEQHAMWGKCMHEIKDRNRPVSQWQRYDCGCLCSVMPADRDTLLSGLEEIMQVMYQILLNLVKIIKTCRLSILILSLQLGLESILQTHRPVSDLDC